MQPYFLPYAGYFRLLAAVDLFVIYDCVQFPRRGWVHRNRLQTATGEPDWLTLPLHRPPWQARIDTIRLAEDAADRLDEAGRRFPVLTAAPGAALFAELVLAGAAGAPLLRDYLEAQMIAIAGRLDLTPEFRRSSDLELSPDLRGQDRILAICEALGATTYVNAPGGTELYEADAFAARGITLRFLAPWSGPYDSILQCLAEQPAAEVAAAIRTQC